MLARNIFEGIPQESVLGPIFFKIYTITRFLSNGATKNTACIAELHTKNAFVHMNKQLRAYMYVVSTAIKKKTTSALTH